MNCYQWLYKQHDNRQTTKKNIDELLEIIKKFDNTHNTNLLNDEFIREFVVFLYHNSYKDKN